MLLRTVGSRYGMNSYAPRVWGYRVLRTLLVTVPKLGTELGASMGQCQAD